MMRRRDLWRKQLNGKEKNQKVFSASERSRSSRDQLLLLVLLASLVTGGCKTPSMLDTASHRLASTACRPLLYIVESSYCDCGHPGKINLFEFWDEGEMSVVCFPAFLLPSSFPLSSPSPLSVLFLSFIPNLSELNF